MEFRVGDRVIAIKEYDNNKDIINKIGTVRYYDWGYYGVEFDEKINNGHRLDGNICKYGHGWNIDGDCLIMANKNRRIIKDVV